MDLYIPKFKDLILPEATVRPRLQGFFKMTAIRPDGRERPLTGWFPNLITDYGLNQIGAASTRYVYTFVVGSGNTAPVVGDTTMETFVAQSSATTTVNATGRAASAPYYGWQQWTKRFGVGVAQGNLSEVGVAVEGTTNCFSRALILDGVGSPTTITVLSDEILDVSYELRIYAPAADVNDSVTIEAVSRTTVLRASDVTSATEWSDNLGTVAGLATGAPCTAYNGALGAVTAAPAGSSSNAGSVVNSAYVGSSLEKEMVASWGTSEGNLASGISAIRFITNHGRYQVSFSPTLDKTDQKTLSLTYNIAWARR